MESYFVRAVAACFGLVSTALTHAAAAQDVPSDPPAETADADAGNVFGANRASRPLVMPAGNVRAGVTVNVLGIDFGSGTESGSILAIGGGVTVVENLEVGFEGRREGSSPFAGGGLLGIVMTPASGVADIPFYARYQFVDTGTLQVAAELDMNLPVDLSLDVATGFVDGGFGIGGAVPVRVHPHDRVAIDTGVQAMFYTGYGAGFGVLRVPVLVRGSIGEMGYVGGGTQFTTDFDVNFLDLGIEGGVSMAVGAGMLDVEASVGFPALVAFADGRSDTITEIWMTSLNARYHFDAF